MKDKSELGEDMTELSGNEEVGELDGRKKCKTKCKTKKKMSAAQKKAVAKFKKLGKVAQALVKKFRCHYPNSTAQHKHVTGRIMKHLFNGDKPPTSKTGIKNWALGEGELGETELSGSQSSAKSKAKSKGSRAASAAKTKAKKTTKNKARSKPMTTRKTKPKPRKSSAKVGELGKTATCQKTETKKKPAKKKPVKKVSINPVKMKIRIEDPFQKLIEHKAENTFMQPKTRKGKFNLTELDIKNFLIFAWGAIYPIWLTENKNISESGGYKEIKDDSFVGRQLKSQMNEKSISKAKIIYRYRKAMENALTKVGESKVKMPVNIYNLFVLTAQNMKDFDDKAGYGDNFGSAMYQALSEADKKAEGYTPEVLKNAISSHYANETQEKGELDFFAAGYGQRENEEYYGNGGRRNWGDELGQDDDDEDFEIFGQFDDDEFMDDDDLDLFGQSALGFNQNVLNLPFMDSDNIEAEAELQLVGSSDSDIEAAMNPDFFGQGITDTPSFNPATDDVEDLFGQTPEITHENIFVDPTMSMVGEGNFI